MYNNLYHFCFFIFLPWNALRDAEAPQITTLSWNIDDLCLSEPGILKMFVSWILLQCSVHYPCVVLNNILGEENT